MQGCPSQTDSNINSSDALDSQNEMKLEIRGIDLDVFLLKDWQGTAYSVLRALISAGLQKTQEFVPSNTVLSSPEIRLVYQESLKKRINFVDTSAKIARLSQPEVQELSKRIVDIKASYEEDSKTHKFLRSGAWEKGDAVLVT